MAETKLTNYPSAEAFLSRCPVGHDASDHTLTPFSAAFNQIAVREYITLWHEWHVKNRHRFDDLISEELCRNTYEQYAKIEGASMPWIWRAIPKSRDFTAAGTKPIDLAYSAAKIETLSSLEVFEKLFTQGYGNTSIPEIRRWLEDSIAAVKTRESPRSIMFDAVANAYEHIFSFAFRMIDEFRIDYGGDPMRDEFDALAQQLRVKIFDETRLSRRENVIHELHFDLTDRFFSFTAADGGIGLGINHPTPEEREFYLSFINSDDYPAGDRLRQQHEIDSGEHYGCPGTIFARLIFNQVTGIIREGAWPSPDFDRRSMTRIEKIMRPLLTAGPSG